MSSGPIQEKSYLLALKITAVARKLQTKDKEYVLSRQVLRAGTSVGANAEEATAGLSRRDFTAKLCVASKEARETR